MTLETEKNVYLVYVTTTTSYVLHENHSIEVISDNEQDARLEGLREAEKAADDDPCEAVFSDIDCYVSSTEFLNTVIVSYRCPHTPDMFGDASQTS